MDKPVQDWENLYQHLGSDNRRDSIGKTIGTALAFTMLAVVVGGLSLGVSWLMLLEQDRLAIRQLIQTRDAQRQQISGPNIGWQALGMILQPNADLQITVTTCRLQAQTHGEEFPQYCFGPLLLPAVQQELTRQLYPGLRDRYQLSYQEASTQVSQSCQWVVYTLFNYPNKKYPRLTTSVL